MQFFALATLLIAGSVTAFASPLEKRTNQKANEYGSPDCTGPINYGCTDLGAVNMDPSSHSVYLAGTTWHAWSVGNLDGNGNSCSGTNLGALGGACQNLDTALPGGRIACLSTS